MKDRLGAGAMGCLFGALPSESGQEVTLLDVIDAHLTPYVPRVAGKPIAEIGAFMA